MDGAVIASDKPAAQPASSEETAAPATDKATAATEETVTLQTETDSQPAEN